MSSSLSTLRAMRPARSTNGAKSAYGLVSFFEALSTESSSAARAAASARVIDGPSGIAFSASAFSSALTSSNAWCTSLAMAWMRDCWSNVRSPSRTASRKRVVYSRHSTRSKSHSATLTSPSPSTAPGKSAEATPWAASSSDDDRVLESVTDGRLLLEDAGQAAERRGEGGGFALQPDLEIDDVDGGVDDDVGREAQLRGGGAGAVGPLRRAGPGPCAAPWRSTGGCGPAPRNRPAWYRTRSARPGPAPCTTTSRLSSRRAVVGPWPA